MPTKIATSFCILILLFQSFSLAQVENPIQPPEVISKIANRGNEAFLTLTFRNASKQIIYLPRDIASSISWSAWKLTGNEDDMTLDPLTEELVRTDGGGTAKYRKLLERLLAERDKLICLQPSQETTFSIPLGDVLTSLPRSQKDTIVVEAELRNILVGQDSLSKEELFSLFRTRIYSEQLKFQNGLWEIF